MLQMYDASDALHLDVLRCLAIGMRLPAEYFTPLCNGRCNTLRLLHYPGCTRGQLSDAPTGVKRAGAHTDLGSITLLHQRGAGLYVCNRDGLRAARRRRHRRQRGGLPDALEQRRAA